jgi:myo-inositol-1(or 4)-monophosphatase
MSESDERELLAVAEEAARAAALELRLRFGQRPEGVHSKSGPTDLVSDADLKAETAIRAVLAERRPGDAVLGEEGGGAGGTAPGDTTSSEPGELRWVVDPLDGTVNFLFGIPVFAVSIACEDSAGALAGVVLDPIRDECFTATRSSPPFVNGEPIRASSHDDLATAMVATGFAYDVSVRARQAAVVARVLPRVRDIRRCGAAALDLAWAACGRYDAYYERGLHAWDLAAGALIASRAGLDVHDLPAVGDDPEGVVVAPAALIDELFGLVAGS